MEIGNVLTPLAKSVSISLGLKAAASTTDVAIHEKMFGSGVTTLITSLEESCFLIKGVREAIKNEVKEQKGGFLRMLLGTLGASLLGNLVLVY